MDPQPTSIHGVSHNKKRVSGGRGRGKQMVKVKMKSSTIMNDAGSVGSAAGSVPTTTSTSMSGSPASMLSNPAMGVPGMSKFSSLSPRGKAKMLLNPALPFVTKVAMVRGSGLSAVARKQIVTQLWGKQSEATRNKIRSVVAKLFS